LLLLGCRPRDSDYDLAVPSGVPTGRPSGCVDTPFLGPDPYNASRGIDCTPRTSRASVTMLRGKVVEEALAGLPGAGLEGMLVSVHPASGTPTLSRLPKPLAEATTDAQGSFVLSAVLGAGTYFVAVRPSADQAAVTIQQVSVVERDSQTELLLRVPVDPKLREAAKPKPAPPLPHVDPPPSESKPEGPEPPPSTRDR
jgi:hypothetical protein